MGLNLVGKAIEKLSTCVSLPSSVPHLVARGCMAIRRQVCLEGTVPSHTDLVGLGVRLDQVWGKRAIFFQTDIPATEVKESLRE